MSIPKEYNFQLKDSGRKFSETWKKIQNKSEFHDVTLACDEYQLNAHKVILSSFSPVFQKILTSNYHQHPVIYLRGISYSILNSIIEFIYKGEVGISQESVEEFLSVANELKIKGLYEDDRKESISINISETDFFANYNNDNSNNQLPITCTSQNVVDSKEECQISDNHESLTYKYNDFNKIEEFKKLVETEDHTLIPPDNNEKQISFVKTEKKNSNETKQTEYAVSFLREGEKELIFYHCNKCEHKTNYKQNLTKHLKTHQENQLSLYHCNDCDHKTNYKHNLITHIKIQHSGVQFLCEICDFSFKTQTDLKKHVQSKHLGVKYSCNHCDHSSHDKRNLKKHIATQHEGVRQSCDRCEKSYGNKSQLLEHIKSKHEGLRYICKYCNNKYIEKTSLRNHIALQHGDDNSENDRKSYSCDQCEFKSAFKSNLRKHIASKHEGVRYYCDQCDHKSTQTSHLKDHIEHMHK